jgi:hypothetical protein
MAIATATLGGIDLPLQFSYTPYIQEKRMKTVQSANAVCIYEASPTNLVHGDSFLAWSIEAAHPTEFQVLYDQYNTAALTGYRFVGYWGEILDVYFTKFDPPTVKNTLFELSGEFQVMCVVVDYAAVCVT